MSPSELAATARFHRLWTGIATATLLSALSAVPSHAQCADQDDFLAVSGGNLAPGDAFDTLFELQRCEASGGTVGGAPPIEWINPNAVINGYDLLVPDPADDLSYRFVPLCADGSGDHEYTITAGASGVAPTCAAADWIRCGDGTRPLYWADQAIEGTETEPQDLISDDWVFFVEGGANCSREVNRGDEFTPPLNDDLDQGEMCVIQYASSRSQMTSDGERRSRSLGGLMSTREENPFRGSNRVVIDRCTQDLWLGDRDAYATWTDSDDLGAPAPGARSYTLFRHGHRIFEAVLTDLADGSANFPRLDTAGTYQLPPLVDAETVLLAGHSNGAFGLIFSGDRLEQHLRQQVGVDSGTRVRLLLDNRLKPGLENEAGFNAPPITCGGARCTLYDFVALGTSSHAPLGAYDHRQYLPQSLPGARDGHEHERFASWGNSADAALDDSCVAAHTVTGDAWRCRDFVHSAANHLATPFFVHSSLQDTALRDQAILFAEDPINDAWNLAAFQPRITQQLEDLVDLRATESDEGLDNSTWSMAIFAPEQSRHVTAVDNESFFDVCLRTTLGSGRSYAEALHEWLENDAPDQGNAVAFRLIEGAAVDPAVPCLPLLFADGFEVGSLVNWSSWFP